MLDWERFMWGSVIIELTIHTLTVKKKTTNKPHSAPCKGFMVSDILSD